MQTLVLEKKPTIVLNTGDSLLCAVVEEAKAKGVREPWLMQLKSGADDEKANQATGHARDTKERSRTHGLAVGSKLEVQHIQPKVAM